MTAAVVRLKAKDEGFDAVTEKAARGVRRIGEAAQISARQTTAAMRQLPAQFTDIATSLAGGQNPLLVLLQQGGQIKDSFGGIGPAFRAIAASINPIGLAVTAAGGAIAALGAAALRGTREAEAFSRAIILSGNAASTSADELSEMSRSIAAIAGTRGAAADALTVLAQGGEVAAQQLKAAAQAAVQLERAGGPAVEKTAQALARLGKDPLQATRELGRELGYLTPKLYDQVRALVDQGRSSEAARIAQDGYTKAIASQAQELESSLGLLARSWRAVKDRAAEAWDGMADIGRAETTIQRLQTLNAELAQAERMRSPGANLLLIPGLSGREPEDIRSERGSLNRSLINRAETQAAGGAMRELAERYAKARDEAGKWAEAGLGNAQKLTRALVEFRDQVKLIRDQGGTFTDAQAKAGEKAIRDRFAAEKNPFGAIGSASGQYKSDFLRSEKAAYAELAEAAAQQAEELAKRERESILQIFRDDKEDSERNTRRAELNRSFLTQLEDDNARAGARLIDDERSRGLRLIELDRQVAEARLKTMGLAGDELTRAQSLMDERLRLAMQELDHQIADRAGSRLSESISEGILNGFRSGRSIAQIFLDELKAQFAKTVLEPRIKPIVEAGNQAIGALLKLIGGALAGGGGGDESRTGAYIHGRHAQGLPYVPFDGYRAELHRGERVLTANENRSLGAPLSVEVNVHGAPAGVQSKTVRRTSGKVFVDVVLQEVSQSIRSGGQVGQAIGGTFGANRGAVAARKA